MKIVISPFEGKYSLFCVPLSAASQLERKAFLGRVVRERERVFGVPPGERAGRRRAAGGAELQREARGEGGAGLAVQAGPADLRLWRRLQDPVRDRGPGRRLRSVRGEHLQVGLVRPARPAAGARRGDRRLHRVPGVSGAPAGPAHLPPASRPERGNGLLGQPGRPGGLLGLQDARRRHRGAQHQAVGRGTGGGKQAQDKVL